MKIGFCGTMSVGKTTLVNALKELPEFKDYYFRTERSKHLMDLGIPLNTDRTVVDVMAFANLSTSMGYREKVFLALTIEPLINEYDLLFYVSPEGVEIEDNGVRETDADYRIAIDEEIKSIIQMNGGKKIITIKGAVEERIKQVKSAITQYV